MLRTECRAAAPQPTRGFAHASKDWPAAAIASGERVKVGRASGDGRKYSVARGFTGWRPWLHLAARKQARQGVPQKRHVEMHEAARPGAAIGRLGDGSVQRELVLWVGGVDSRLGDVSDAA